MANILSQDTPAMQLGITSRVWELSDIVSLLDGSNSARANAG